MPKARISDSKAEFLKKQKRISKNRYRQYSGRNIDEE
jgi:hypothetical protein